MNAIDIILLIPLCWAIYKGFTKGLVIELATLIGLVLGIYGAVHFSFIANSYLSQYFEISEKLLPYISFGATFLVIIILVFALAKLIETFLKATALNIFNRIAGVVFSLLKFGLILSVIISLIEPVDRTLNLIPKETKNESLLYNPIKMFAPFIFPYLKEIKGKVEEKIENTSH
jgi:membrane protein required for colicin V production